MVRKHSLHVNEIDCLNHSELVAAIMSNNSPALMTYPSPIAVCNSVMEIREKI